MCNHTSHDTSPEYLDFRCCMCPNANDERKRQSVFCPTGPFKDEVTPCRFIKAYVDEQGMVYRVKTVYPTAFYAAHCLDTLQCIGVWRESFDAAQADLNRHAKAHGWAEYSLEVREESR